MVTTVGTTIIQDIDTVGFAITDKLKLLGLEITNNALNFESNFVAIWENMQKIANLWKHFQLTLPGRISVVKGIVQRILRRVSTKLK
jgi:hypothetical protein